MKKERILYGVVFLLLAIVLVGCRADEKGTESEEVPSYDEIYQANNMKTLLDKYENCYFSQVNYLDGAVNYTAYRYNEDHNMETYSVWPSYEAYQEYDYLLDIDHGTESVTIYPGIENEDDSLIFLMDGLEENEIKKSENGDYTIQGEIVLDEEQAASYGYEKDDILSAQYVFHPDTLELKNISWTATRTKDGKTEEYCTMYFYYQKDDIYPTKLMELREGANHTVEMHYEDGTSRTYQVPANVPLSFELSTEDQKLYTDAEYTEALTETTEIDLKNDMILYCK